MAEPGIDLAALHMLTGTTYGWYRDPARIRADDLLVRSHAGAAMNRAATALRAAESEIRRGLPTPTRENPFPAEASTQALRHLNALLHTVLALETRLRGSACLPDRDFTTTRGVPAEKREGLVACDAALIAAAEAAAIAPETCLPTLEAAIAAREAAMASAVAA